MATKKIPATEAALKELILPAYKAKKKILILPDIYQQSATEVISILNSMGYSATVKGKNIAVDVF